MKQQPVKNQEMSIKQFATICLLGIVLYGFINYPLACGLGLAGLVGLGIALYVKNSRFRAYLSQKLHFKGSGKAVQAVSHKPEPSQSQPKTRPEQRYFCPKAGCGGALEVIAEWPGHGLCDTCNTVQRIIK